MLAVTEQHTLFDEGDPEDVSLRERVEIARRQRGTLLRGWHPISGHPLHQFAAPVDDKSAKGLRCRTCHFAVRGVPKDVFKCALDQGRYVSHDPETDLKLSFPACNAYTPDTALSGGDQ
jgi:hypothetical protein